MNMMKQSARRGATALVGLLLGIACCLWPAQASAQEWTTTGDNISNTNTGNVTVKSDADVSPLIVRGKNPNVVGFIVSNDDIGSKVWGFQVPGSNSAAGVPNGSFIIRQASDNLNPFVIAPLGNVGIGTLRPNYKLDVIGSLNASGGLCMAGVCKSSWAEVGGGVTSQWTSGGSNIFYSSGNVGIGTTTPTAKLDVIQANGSTIRGLSGSMGAHANIQLGRAVPEFSLGIAAASGHYSTDAATGDVTLRTENSNTKILLSNGSGPSGLAVANGNVGIGTASPSTKLQVVGNINATGDITANGNIAAKYQDVAEWVPSEQRLPAGTVVVLDEAKINHVLASTSSYDTKVAGVVTAQPGVILGEGGEGKLMVATTGRVKVKVDATRGPIRVGDLLVTSEVEGVAMRSVAFKLGGVPIHRPGTIIGKALEPLEKGAGEILVLLSLQ